MEKEGKVKERGVRWLHFCRELRQDCLINADVAAGDDDDNDDDDAFLPRARNNRVLLLLLLYVLLKKRSMMMMLENFREVNLK